MTETRADRETGRGGGGWTGSEGRRTVSDRWVGAGQEQERKVESLKNRFGKNDRKFTQHYPLLPPGGEIN